LSTPGSPVPGRVSILMRAALAIVTAMPAWVAAQNLRPAPTASEAPASEVPAPLRGVEFEQRLGESIDLDLVFRDEAGREVRLRDCVRERPIILALVYYECPMLCTMVLNGLAGCLNALQFDAGREFDILTVSFDPGETAAMAAAKKKMYLERYQRPTAKDGWHFLTGSEAAIHALAESIGFRYTYDSQTDQYAHASGLVVLTPRGRISRYFYGIEYAPRDVRLGLVEAADSKIGTFVDQVLLYCFHYDPATGKYGAAIMRLVRVGGILMVAALASFLVVMWRRERGRRAVRTVSDAA